MTGLCISQFLESRAEFCLRENSETEVLIERAVPRDVYESGEGQRFEAFRDGPRFSLLDQGASNPMTPDVRDQHSLARCGLRRQ